MPRKGIGKELYPGGPLFVNVESEEYKAFAEDLSRRADELIHAAQLLSNYPRPPQPEHNSR